MGRMVYVSFLNKSRREGSARVPEPQGPRGLITSNASSSDGPNKVKQQQFFNVNLKTLTIFCQLPRLCPRASECGSFFVSIN